MPTLDQLAAIPPRVAAILDRPICELGLKIEGSPLERPIARLHHELERRGLRHFRPACYLTDEWGCPSGEPVIGIPFYLADARLRWLEAAINDLETPREVMMYLRHEAGHAFNYAYRAHRAREWGELFGSFRRPYRDHYRPVAFSRDYVRHIAGWYAQKHPDEDFAETFAVWLTPGSNWRRKFSAGAARKLAYVDRIARQLGPELPPRPRGRTDFTSDEMTATVRAFYRGGSPFAPQRGPDAVADADGAAANGAANFAGNIAAGAEGDLAATASRSGDGAGLLARNRPATNLATTTPPAPDIFEPLGNLESLSLDADLADIFLARSRGRSARGSVLSAAEFARAHRKTLTDKVTYWTGVQRPLVKNLVESMEQRLARLGLRADARRESEHVAELATYLTALAMNALHSSGGARPRRGHRTSEPEASAPPLPAPRPPANSEGTGETS